MQNLENSSIKEFSIVFLPSPLPINVKNLCIIKYQQNIIKHTLLKNTMEGKFRFYALKLCLFIILVFAFQVLSSGFTEKFILNQSSWTEPWRFLASIFLHGNVMHLAYNLFALALFGSILEKFIGGRRFLLVFFVTGIGANLIAVNFYSSSLGASGAIFGIIGALIFIRPLMVVWAFGLPMPIFIAGILWAIGDIMGVFGYGAEGIGNIAHLSGMLLGFLFGAGYREKTIRAKKKRIAFDEKSIREWEDRYIR